MLAQRLEHVPRNQQRVRHEAGVLQDGRLREVDIGERIGVLAQAIVERVEAIEQEAK